MWGRLCSGGMAGDSVSFRGWDDDRRGEPPNDGMRLCSFLPGEWKATPRISALTRRVKSARWDARLDVVEADQRLRLRKVSLRPPALLERECPRLCLESLSLTESGILGAGRGSLNGSRRKGAASCGEPGSTTILAGGNSDEERGGLPGARDEARGGFGGKVEYGAGGA
jgi:hypothetical protein